MDPQRNQFLGGLPFGLGPLYLTTNIFDRLGLSLRQCVANGLSNVGPALGEKTLANVRVEGMLFNVADACPVNSEFFMRCGQCQFHRNGCDCLWPWCGQWYHQFQSWFSAMQELELSVPQPYKRRRRHSCSRRCVLRRCLSRWSMT